MILQNNEEYHTECNKTLKYVGPIVDGGIVGTVPKFPIFVGTFNGLTELVHLPNGLPKYDIFNAFVGCCNLDPTIEELKAWDNTFGSGYRDPNIFGGCKSPHIIDLGVGNANTFETLGLIFDKSESEVQNLLKSIKEFSEYEWNHLKTRQLNSSWALQECNTEILMMCIKALNYHTDMKFSTGAGIEFKEISKSSELEYSAQKCYQNIVLSSRFRPLRVGDTFITCYILSDDFIVDTDDVTLINNFGRLLQDTHMTVPYVAGADATIEVKGDSSITTADVCPLQASGTLTIKGSGTLLLECKDNQQACIGTNTHTGMSYGRWEPGYGKQLNQIIIDGVHVICKSSVPNFSIGSYGEEDIPTITCVNGGSLECPEMTGTRIMIQSGNEDLSGSTKRVSPAKYEIVSKSNVPSKINI